MKINVVYNFSISIRPRLMGIIRQLYSVQCCLLYIYLCFCFGIIFLAWVMYGMEQSYLHHKINTDSWQYSHPLDSAHRFFLIAQNNILTSTARTTCDAHRWMIMASKTEIRLIRMESGVRKTVVYTDLPI